jgi:hypothetical protein
VIYSALLSALLLGVAGGASAQDDSLVVEGEIAVITRQDAFGQAVQIGEGLLRNTSEDDAFTNVTLFADIYDAEDALIGEGIGFLVNACGAGLLPGYALQPGAAHLFDVQLELYEDDAAIDRIDIRAQGDPTEPTTEAEVEIDGIRRISSAEVVAVEWLDRRALRFAAGCNRALFTTWTWQQYSLRTDATTPVMHPRADEVTADFFARVNLTTPDLIANSALSFAPNGSRVIVQGEVNRLRTTQADGQFPRLLYETFFNRTLQGIYWLPDDGDGSDNFLAYYFGASGDPVYYFTATEDARALSQPPDNNPLSEIIPGVAPDGVRAVIAGAFGDDATPGYYYKLLSQRSEPTLLFEAQPAGNNYPPPIFTADERIYIARPVEGEDRLQCFNRATETLIDLSALPLRLAADERALWWLSPDGATIALAANGTNGGLWLIDLAALPGC